MLFISRDAYSDSIAKQFGACFFFCGISHNYPTMCCKVGYTQGIAPLFGELLRSLKKYRAMWGMAAIVIAISRHMGPQGSVVTLVPTAAESADASWPSTWEKKLNFLQHPARHL